MREWLVASGLIADQRGALLLVQNLRRDGSLDWSPPGGVIEVHEGEGPVDGLTREVAEETGIRVVEWEGPLWEVETLAPDMGWHLRAQVYRAVRWQGELSVGDDPDGIVVDARFVDVGECPGLLCDNHLWVREPVGAWLVGSTEPLWRYRVDGPSARGATVTRL